MKAVALVVGAENSLFFNEKFKLFIGRSLLELVKRISRGSRGWPGKEPGNLEKGDGLLGPFKRLYEAL